MSHMEGNPWFCLILENTFLRSYSFSWTYYRWVSANGTVPICDSGLFILLWSFDSFKILPPPFLLLAWLSNSSWCTWPSGFPAEEAPAHHQHCTSLQGCAHLPMWNQIYSFLARNQGMSCWGLFLWNTGLHNTFHCTSQGDVEVIARSWFSTYLQLGIWHTEGLRSWGMKGGAPVPQ